MKPRPLQTAPALVCLSGLVQSSRLTPSTLEAVVWPAKSSRSLLAGLSGNALLESFPLLKRALEAQTFEAQGRRKLKPPVLLLLCFMLGASSAVPKPSMLTPQVPFA